MNSKLNDIEKTSSSINIIGILISLMVLAIIYIIRVDVLPVLSIIDYVRLFALIIILLILPDLVHKSLIKFQKWYTNIESNTIFLLLILGITGIIAGRYIITVSYLLMVLGVFLLIWEVYRFFKFKGWITVIFGVITLLFLTLIFYSQSWHSPLFPEQIILGSAFVDTLFHSSISNMFSSLGYPSTGLDGAPYIHYHWGSHVLFSGLREWTGFNAIMFYNIAYPLIFIPMFVKSLILLTQRYFNYKKIAGFNLLTALSVITLIYSLGIITISEARAMPMNGESLCLSIIFSFFYFSILLFYFDSHRREMLSFFTFSLIIIILISFFKISTGFVMLLGLSFLLIRVRPSYQSMITVVIAIIVVSALVFSFIYPLYRNETSISIGNRLLNYWHWSAGFVTYFMGFLIFLAVLIGQTKNLKISSLIQALKTRKYIDLELLAVINIIGAGGALWVTSNSGDVYLFFALQLMLSTVYLIFFSHRVFNYISLEKSRKLILVLIIVFSIIATPQVIPGLFRLYQPKKYFSKLTDDQKVLKELVIELSGLDHSVNKKKTCIYIPPEEDWYYNPDLSFKEVFIVPALSGIASINSVSPKLLQSEYNYFSIAYYRDRPGPKINNLENSISKASAMGYTKLLLYKRLNDHLIRESYSLK